MLMRIVYCRLASGDASHQSIPLYLPMAAFVREQGAGLVTSTAIFDGTGCCCAGVALQLGRPTNIPMAASAGLCWRGDLPKYLEKHII